MQIIRLYHDLCPTPLGDLVVATTETHLVALTFGGRADLEGILAKDWGQSHWAVRGNPLGICDRIQAYFAGDEAAFVGVPFLLGGTAFQQRVWRCLQDIPAGTTLTYGALAAQMGNPAASRAVGAAVGRNRIAIAIPCHRVVGASGQLTGYAWGLERKQWLLNHEAVQVRRSEPCLP